MSRPDVEAMAADVVLLMKSTIGPVLQRIAVAEARLEGLVDVRDRLVIMETKAAMPLPAVDIAPGPDSLSAIATLQARIEALESTPVVVVPEIAPEDIAASVAGLLRNELSDLEPPPRLQKRIVRDAQGHIERVIEEPI